MVEKIDKVLYQEIQKFRQLWVWVLLLLTFSMFTFRFTEQPSIIGGLLSIGLIYLFYVMNLVTEVRESGIYVKFFPLLRQKRIEFADIKSCEARVYDSLREYGGWGVRDGNNGKAYNVSGDQGVQLEFAQGKPLLIGSQRADELAEVINSMR